jgi:hypothetical protein
MKDMINNTSINSNLIAQNTGQSAVRIIQQHLLTNKFNVIETLFPSAGPGFDAEGLDQLEQAEGSDYVKGLRFIVRDKNGELSQKTYSQIRGEKEEAQSINRRNVVLNIVGIVEKRGGVVYGVEDIKSFAKNEAVFNRNATGLGNLFTDPNGKNTLTGASLKKLN